MIARHDQISLSVRDRHRLLAFVCWGDRSDAMLLNLARAEARAATNAALAQRADLEAAIAAPSAPDARLV